MIESANSGVIDCLLACLPDVSYWDRQADITIRKLIQILGKKNCAVYFIDNIVLDFLGKIETDVQLKVKKEIKKQNSHVLMETIRTTEVILMSFHS